MPLWRSQCGARFPAHIQLTRVVRFPSGTESRRDLEGRSTTIHDSAQLFAGPESRRQSSCWRTALPPLISLLLRADSARVRTRPPASSPAQDSSGPALVRRWTQDDVRLLANEGSTRFSASRRCSGRARKRSHLVLTLCTLDGEGASAWLRLPRFTLDSNNSAAESPANQKENSSRAGDCTLRTTPYIRVSPPTLSQLQIVSVFRLRPQVTALKPIRG